MSLIVRASRTLPLAVLALFAAACGAGYRAPAVLLEPPPAPEGGPGAGLQPALTALGSVDRDRAVLLAVAADPEVRAAAERVLAADAARVQAGAPANPRLHAEADAWEPGEGLDASERSLSLGWPVDLFGVRGARADEADAALQGARVGYAEARRNAGGRARESVHDLLAAGERLRIADRILETAVRTAEAVVRQVEAGRAPDVERLRAEAQLHAARADREAAGRGVERARRRLARLCGADPEAPAAVSAALRESAALPARADLERELLERHPAVLLARWDQERERRRHRRLGRERWPEVEPELGVVRRPDDPDWAVTAGLSVSLPLFDGKGAARRDAGHRAAAAGASAAAARRDLALTLDELLDAFAATGDLLRAYREEVVPRARAAAERTRLGYDRGKFDVLHLLEAEAALNDVERARAEALIDHDRALVRLEALLGRALAPDPPEEARP